MNETQKTIAFVAAAVLALGAAWFGRPSDIGEDASEQVGEILFPALTDPLAARSMEIKEFLAGSGEVKEFQVQQKQGLWVLPSHQDYPADAEDNLKEAATALVDLKVINVASEKKSDHTTFGVVRPDADKSEIGDEGVGKLVTIKDEQAKTLAEIIIGKEVQGQEGQHYVRAGNLDQVFVVEIDPSKMSTKFEDWVERDVLDLNGFDIESMTVQDYSLNPTFDPSTGRIRISEEPRLNMTVKYVDSEWQIESLQEFRGDEMRTTELLPGEELSTEALNTMKDTLDELKIVDVQAKPSGLVAGGEAGDSAWQDRQGIQALFDNGFYPTEGEDGTIQIRSSDGQVQTRTKDGVVYTLWFGEVSGIEAQSEDASLNRFVMIQASVDESMFEKPVLELTEAEMALTTGQDQPETPDAETTEADPAEAEPAEAATPAPDADGEAAGAAGENADGDDEAASTEPDPDPESENQTEGSADPAETEQTVTDDENQGDESLGDEEPSSADAADSEAANPPAEVETAEQSGAATVDAEDAAVQAERDRKLKQYERDMDDYNERIKKAREKAQELNFRFADWYYVVSEDEYRKIHLSRSDIVTESEEAAAEGDDIDAFRRLQDGGLSKDAGE